MHTLLVKFKECFLNTPGQNHMMKLKLIALGFHFL